MYYDVFTSLLDKMITLLYRLLNRTLNVFKIFDRESRAYDEVVKDHRDFAAWKNDIWEELPDEFILDDKRRLNQGRTSHCTAYSVDWACNSELWFKADKDLEYNGDDLAQSMIKEWTLSPRWALIIDAVKMKKSKWEIDSYYQVNTQLDMMTALHRYTNPIATWSNKINWRNVTPEWNVLEAKKDSPWHAFCIIGWSKVKKIWTFKWGWYCKNSWGEKRRVDWGFWIPFALTNQILFNTKKALVLIPEWSKN